MSRYFEFEDAKSSKFWEIELQGSSFTVRFGRMGTNGQSQTKDFASPDKAKVEHDKLVAEKVGKGYVEKAGAQADRIPARTATALKSRDEEDFDEEGEDEDEQDDDMDEPTPPARARTIQISANQAIASGGVRNFEFDDGKSQKFWQIQLKGSAFTVRFGRLGTDGQTQTKEFDSDAAAQKEYDKLVAEKLKKGYCETGSATGSALETGKVKTAGQAKRKSADDADDWEEEQDDAWQSDDSGEGVRYFEYQDDKSSKFWEIELSDRKFRVRFGKIGTDGQTQVKNFGSAAEAQKEYDKLITEKTKKGYEEML